MLININDEGLEQVLESIELIGVRGVSEDTLLFHQYDYTDPAKRIMARKYDDFEVCYHYSLTMENFGRYFDFMALMRRID